MRSAVDEALRAGLLAIAGIERSECTLEHFFSIVEQKCGVAGATHCRVVEENGAGNGIVAEVHLVFVHTQVMRELTAEHYAERAQQTPICDVLPILAVAAHLHEICVVASGRHDVAQHGSAAIAACVEMFVGGERIVVLLLLTVFCFHASAGDAKGEAVTVSSLVEKEDLGGVGVGRGAEFQFLTVGVVFVLGPRSHVEQLGQKHLELLVVPRVSSRAVLYGNGEAGRFHHTGEHSPFGNAV